MAPGLGAEGAAASSMLHDGVETSWDKCRIDDAFAIGASDDKGMFFLRRAVIESGRVSENQSERDGKNARCTGRIELHEKHGLLGWGSDLFELVREQEVLRSRV